MFDEFKGKKFSLIYADPAWQFNNKRTGGSMTSGAEHQYKSVMGIKDIKAMPVADIAADNCILVMWWVNSMPSEALEVVKAWGFELKNMNGFVWNKLTKKSKPFFGMGFYTRAGSESALIAIKGKPQIASRSVRAVGSYPVREHSRKPDEFRAKCDKLGGEVNKIELFARESTPGWSSWGNEVNKFSEHAAA
ncbi:MT-A70 family methyltransferase [Pseudoalteromonas spongiae]|uniref:MT-A70 family methyltransferase n=1 Tax=Pseudoalteromonas spongiae TaxID=298657 RepID=UPI0018E2104F|nr:MT-A70 family methyltransferase [Pseudoalteromonas spongiae]